MKSPLSYRSNMRHRSVSRKLLFPQDFHLPSRKSSQQDKPMKSEPQSVYDAWVASRQIPGGQKGTLLVPGAPRPLTLENARLALYVIRKCFMDFVS